MIPPSGFKGGKVIMKVDKAEAGVKIYL